MNIALTLLAAAALALPASAAAPATAATKDAAHPLVRHLTDLYGRCLAAEKKGDVAAYKLTRTQETFAFLESQLKKTGRDVSKTLVSLAAYQHPLKRFRFVDAAPAGENEVRLSWLGRGSGPAEALVVQFRLEDGAWRVGKILRLQDPSGKKTPDQALEEAKRTLEREAARR